MLLHSCHPAIILKWETTVWQKVIKHGILSALTSFFTFLHSGDVSPAPSCSQRSAGGLGVWVGHQRDLPLPTWLWALLPRRPHLRGKRNVERRSASVPAWVIGVSFLVFFRPFLKIILGADNRRPDDGRWQVPFFSQSVHLGRNGDNHLTWRLFQTEGRVLSDLFHPHIRTEAVKSIPKGGHHF